MDISIGGVGTCARVKKNNASVATPDMAFMKRNGAVLPTAPVAVSSGTKATRREITLTIVLSGSQPTAPMASPSNSLKVVAKAIHAIIMDKMEAEKDPMWRPVPTPASVSRRGSR